MDRNLNHIEEEAEKTGNMMILNLCLRIRKLFPEWLNSETIDDYIQKEIPESPSSFSSQEINEA